MADAPPALDRALAALSGAKPQPELALAALIEAWQELRAPALAELIDALGEALAPTRPPLAGQTLHKTQAEWLARAESKDPVELSALLPSLSQATSTRALARLRALAPMLPDPRLTKAAVAIASAPPFTSSASGKSWTLLFRMLIEGADPRAVELLEAIPRTGMAYPVGQARIEQQRLRTIEQLREALARQRVAPSEAEAARLAELGPAVTRACAALRPSATEDELLAAIHAEPRALAHRQIYADLLLAQGEPRGEFIALQLADHAQALDRKARARMKALLDEHGRAWIGDLGRVLTRRGRAFERGFLARARLKVEPKQLELVLTDPAWATVEHLDNAPLALLDRAPLRALTSLALDDHLFHHSLAPSGLELPGVERLEIRYIDSWRGVGIYGGTLSPRFQTQVAQMRRLPKLRALCLSSKVLHIDGGQLRWLWESRLVLRRLHSLELRVPADNPSLLRPAVERVELERSPDPLAYIRLVHGDASIRLEPGEVLDRRWRIIIEAEGKQGLPSEVAADLRRLRASGAAAVVTSGPARERDDAKLA